jgi:opacity protein-like surface antigen
MRIRYFLFLACFVLATAVTASAQANQSVYTNLDVKSCKTLEIDNSGSGGSVQQCPGVAGYKLRVLEGDLRQTVVVIRPNGSKNNLDLWTLVGGGGFSSVGAKAEWRMKQQNGKPTPVALIIRFNVSTASGDSSKVTSYLTVAKITPQQICLTDSVNPSPNANEEARRLADSAATRPCLKAAE